MRVGSDRGLALIHGFDDRAVIAGQGTMGLEIVEQAPELDAIIVLIGGAGLIAGVALATQNVETEGDRDRGSTRKAPRVMSRRCGPAAGLRDPAGRRWRMASRSRAWANWRLKSRVVMSIAWSWSRTAIWPWLC